MAGLSHAEPRTPDGKIDLAAAPPRTADGKIDFTGLWEPARAPGRGGAQAKGAPATSPSPAPAPPPAPPPAADNGEPPLGQFFNIGAGFKEGLPPLTPWAAQVRAQRKGEFGPAPARAIDARPDPQQISSRLSDGC